MSKKHSFGQVTVKMGDNVIPLDNHVVIRYSLGYTVKHDGEGVSTDHHHIFNLETTVLRMAELFKNSATIKWVNDRMRPLTCDKAKSLFPRNFNVEYDHIFPGKRSAVIIKEMTKDEMIAALLKEHDGDVNALIADLKA